MKKFKTWNPSIYATILILLFPFLFYVIKPYELNNDFWFLVNTGKVILEKGFITIEPFTIHSNLLFIPQQWLTDVIFYIIYNKFNILGIFILELCINSLIIFLIYKIGLLISKKRNIAIITASIVDLCFLALNMLTTRPQMFDIPIFLLELFFVESYIQNGQKKYLYFIPILSLLLINGHASMWLMLFVFLIPYYFEYIINKKNKKITYKIKPILIITIISFLIGFINPYHIKSILYLFNSYGVNEINLSVGEMMAVDISKGIVVYIMIFIMLLIIYQNKGNNKIRYILLFLGTSYLMLSHYKGTLYFLIVIILIIADFFQNDKKKLKTINISKKEKIIYSFLIFSLIIFISLNIRFEKEPKLKVIADYLDENATKDIKLFTGYDDGSYFEYRGYKCYLDPRAELFLKSNNKKENIFKEYYDLLNNNIEPSLFLKKYNFDYLVVKKDNLKTELVRNNNYELQLEVYDKKNNTTYYLYRRINEKNN